MTFPVIATLYAYGRPLSRLWSRLGIKTFATAEWAYVSAGVCSKVAIFWLIFGTVRDFEENFTEEIPKSGINWPALRLSMMIVPTILLAASIIFYHFAYIEKMSTSFFKFATRRYIDNERERENKRERRRVTNYKT